MQLAKTMASIAILVTSTATVNAEPLNQVQRVSDGVNGVEQMQCTTDSDNDHLFYVADGCSDNLQLWQRDTATQIVAQGLTKIAPSLAVGLFLRQPRTTEARETGIIFRLSVLFTSLAIQEMQRH